MNSRSGLGVQLLDLGNHLLEILAVDAATPHQLGEVGAREEGQIGEEICHRRVEPVLLGQLQGEAFAEIARPDPGRLASLNHGSHSGDQPWLDATAFDQRPVVVTQITIVVEAFHEDLGHRALVLAPQRRQHLFGH